MEIRRALGDQNTLRVVPRAAPNPIAGVDRGSPFKTGTEVRAPGAVTCTNGASQILTMTIGTGQASEMLAIIRRLAGHEESHAIFGGRNRRGLITFNNRQSRQVDDQLLLIFFVNHVFPFRIGEIKDRAVGKLRGIELEPVRKIGAKHRGDEVIAFFKGRSEVVSRSSSLGVHVTRCTAINVRPPEWIRLKTGQILRPRMNRLNQDNQKAKRQTYDHRSTHKSSALKLRGILPLAEPIDSVASRAGKVRNPKFKIGRPISDFGFRI